MDTGNGTMFVAVCYLGHCGAQPNRYELFEGTELEAEGYCQRLPRMGEKDGCQYCGGYTGTVPVREVCQVEEVD